MSAPGGRGHHVPWPPVNNLGDRYGRDVLSPSHVQRPVSAEHQATRGLVVEDVQTGFCGAVVACDKHGVTLEDRHGKRRTFPLGPGFWLDGAPVRLIRPCAPTGNGSDRSASGSVRVNGHRARVARQSRIYVEGKHDAELVEKVWGHDLRVEGVVVEELGGVDDLVAIVSEFQPGPTRRLGIMLDHLIKGTKETRIGRDVANSLHGKHVLVLGHPYVDVWQAVRPAAVGLDMWPVVPRGVPWKEGMLHRLGWPTDQPGAWRRILNSVRSYTDLEPSFLGRVEELIDFVTTPADV